MRKLNDQEVILVFAKDAKICAKTICRKNMCLTYYNCQYRDKAENLIPKIGTDEVCPIAKYNIEYDDSNDKELNAQDITLENLFAVCACCQYASVTETGNVYDLNRSNDDFTNHCLDCPVQQCRNGIEENMAEAAIS